VLPQYVRGNVCTHALQCNHNHAVACFAHQALKGVRSTTLGPAPLLAVVRVRLGLVLLVVLACTDSLVLLLAMVADLYECNGTALLIPSSNAAQIPSALV
jgi:hypothetical protein